MSIASLRQCHWATFQLGKKVGLGEYARLKLRATEIFNKLLPGRNTRQKTEENRMSIVRYMVVLLALVSSSVMANTLTGTIHTLHINLATNHGHIYLDGSPTFDGGGCPAAWTSNSLDEEKFMIYMWPALVNAKNHGYFVSITVDGCESSYPRIVAIDVVPR